MNKFSMSRKNKIGLILFSIHLITIFSIYFIVLLKDAITINLIVFPILQLIAIVIPFSILVLYTLDTDIIRDLFKDRWFTFIIFIIITSYTIILNVNASSIINEIFKVDPNLFENTKIVLTFLSILSIFKFITFDSGVLYFIMAFILCILGFKGKIKELIISFFVILYFSFTYGYFVGTEKNIKDMVRVIANYSDFHIVHRCKNINNIKGYSGLVFLSDNRVLISKVSYSGFKYEIKECIY